MLTAFLYLGCSFGVLLVLSIVFIVEDTRGKRLFSGAREQIDTVLNKVFAAVERGFMYFGKGFLRMLFHYGMHGVLQNVLRFVQRMEELLQSLVRHNRITAKKIRTQTKRRNHLDDISDHKNEVALSDAQKKKIKSHE